jgi:hypothetical protein
MPPKEGIRRLQVGDRGMAPASRADCLQRLPLERRERRRYPLLIRELTSRRRRAAGRPIEFVNHGLVPVVSERKLWELWKLAREF